MTPASWVRDVQQSALCQRLLLLIARPSVIFHYLRDFRHRLFLRKFVTSIKTAVLLMARASERLSVAIYHLTSFSLLHISGVFYFVQQYTPWSIKMYHFVVMTAVSNMNRF